MTKRKSARATTGGTTEALKGKFAAGSIPLDTDFAELIDIADCGRLAIGQSPDQTDNTVGLGLELMTDAADIGKLKVKVKPNGGIVADADGLRCDPMAAMPIGTILMFSGTVTPPTGWHVCDGTTGTPNLKNRFVMGSAGLTAGDTNSDVTMTGGVNAMYVAATTSTTPNSDLVVTVQDHVLLAPEIPKLELKIHDHVYYTTLGGFEEGIASGGDQDRTYGRLATDIENSEYGALYAEQYGDPTTYGQPHNHGATVTGFDHDHTVSVKIPYYSLVFIMKIA
ncbi:phage tail protein [Pararobbsia silviterrae]|nr:phage tail protein [Pararobbsia silviterrae]